MCSNYIPVTSQTRLLSFFGVERSSDEPPLDTWPLGLAPFIKLQEGSTDKLVAEDGHFGLIPHFQTELSAGRMTYNARSETVATKPSFRESWKKGWRCIVPAEVIYENCFETGKAVRWAIFKPSQQPMGIAGIYRRWTKPDGEMVYTFAMLTVNAEGHDVFHRMHRPGDEKRMPVILDRGEFMPWLTGTNEEVTRLFRAYEGPLLTELRPLPTKAPRAVSGRVVVTPPDRGDGDGTEGQAGLF